MNKSYLTVALTLACLFGLGTSARARDAEGVVVKVPFEFVAGSKTMPAGTYSIGRVSSDATSGLIVYSHDNSAIVLPTAVGGSAERATLSFEGVGNMHFLREVDTPAGVYSIGIPQRVTTLQTRNSGTASFSGAN